MTSNPFIPTTSGLQPNAGTLGTPGAIISTSVTSQSITSGLLTFAIQPQCAFGPGMWVSITNAANANQWMWGTVQSYDGVSQLVVNVTNTNGSGTVSAWQIALAGEPNTAGAQGPAGPTGSTGAAAGPLTGNTIGLKVANNAGTPNSKIDITAIAAVMVNSSGTSVRATAVSVTLDLTSGHSSATANGMDGETPGTSAWIYTYLINNGSVTAALGTLSSPLSAAPTMPAGYTSSVYVGAMFVDGSGNLMRSKQHGNQARYSVTATTNTANLPVLANGTAGSVSSPTYAAVAVGSFVPATAGAIALVANANVGGTPVVILVAPNNNFGTATSTNPPPVVSSGDTHVDELVLESTNIYWASSGTDGYLFCYGWEDYATAP